MGHGGKQNREGIDDIEASDLEGPKINRRTTMKLLGAAGLTGLAGCLGSDNSDTGGSSDDTETKSGGKIKAGWAINKIGTLDPHYADVYQYVTVFANIFSGLVKLNKDVEIVGDVAKDWQLPDKSTYVFNLRDDVYFHNGTKVTAKKIQASLERVMNLESSPHQGKVRPIKSIETPSSTKLRLNLSNPVAPFITFLTRGPGRAGTIVAVDSIEKMGQKKYAQTPIGSGPFKVTGRSVAESITLSKFDKYYGTYQGDQLPYLDEVKINLIPEPTTMWTALKNGQIQYSDELPPQNAQGADKIPSVEVVESNAGSWAAISLLCNKPNSKEWRKRVQWVTGSKPTNHWKGKDLPTSHQKVRNAIALAIDRKELVKKVHFGFATEAHSLFNPAIPWLHRKQPKHGQYYKPKKAKQLMADAGYEDGFTGRVLATPHNQRLVTVLQQQLSKIGITLELDIQQESSFWDSIYNYTHMMAIYGGGGDIDPWMSWWKQLKTPEPRGSAGVWQKPLYSNPTFDKYIAQSYRTPDQKKRKDYVRKAEEVFLKDAPFAMTVFPNIVKGESADLKNVRNPVGMSNFHAAYLAKKG
jgi:peptide/nickel transport system substrate-binding protein